MTERPTLPDGQDNEPCDNELVPKYVRERMAGVDTYQRRFSAGETALLRECHAARLTDVETSEKFREKGYTRTSATINSKRRRLGLYQNKIGRPRKAEHKKDLVLDEKEGIPYWRTQRAGGDAFREAMLAAGHREYVDKTPGTSHARMIRAEPILRTHSNEILPPALSNEEARNIRDAARLARRRARYASERARGGPHA